MKDGKVVKMVKMVKMVTTVKKNDAIVTAVTARLAVAVLVGHVLCCNGLLVEM